MKLTVFMDDRIVPPEEATVSIFDHGFLFGDSVYEVVRTYGGYPFRLPQHLERFHYSAASIGLPTPWSDEAIEEAIVTTIEASERQPGEEAYCRWIVTRGPGPLNILPEGCDTPRLIVIVKEVQEPAQKMKTEGIRVAIVSRIRSTPHGQEVVAKTGNYLNSMLASVEARKLGVDEALMKNRDGFLAECPTANFFFVDGSGTICTPAMDSGILAGITRAEVLSLAAELEIPVAEGRYRPEDLLAASEAFITSTTRELLPIRSVDGQPLGSGHRPVLAELRAAFRKRIERFLEEQRG